MKILTIRPGDHLMLPRRAERGASRQWARAAVLFALALNLGGCGFLFGTHKKVETNSSQGITMFGGGANGQPAKVAGSGIGVGVNSFLWHASLDTLSFMPLASADPFGGVIITDWYSPPQTANERFKVTVYILDKRLRADALKVSVFRQEQDSKGAWSDASLDPETPGKIENAILTRARQLRISTPGQ